MPWDQAPQGLMTFDEAIEWLRSYNRHLADIARARAATESMSDQDIAVWLRGHLGPSQYRCSFCGKSQEQVKHLVAGPGAYICDECIEVCHEVVEEKRNGSP